MLLFDLTLTATTAPFQVALYTRPELPCKAMAGSGQCATVAPFSGIQQVQEACCCYRPLLTMRSRQWLHRGRCSGAA